MSFSSPLWWFAIVALCMLLGAALARSIDFYRERLAEAGASRFETIDGLRGYLALGVFGTHAVNMYTLHASGEWVAGIAPFYADKCSKIGICVDELYGGAANLRMRVEQTLAAKNVLFTQLYGKPAVESTAVMGTLARLREVLRPFVTDTNEFFAQALADGKNILLEGQLGALRDPDHGIYPWVTSSSTLAGFAAVGAGLPAASR